MASDVSQQPAVTAMDAGHLRELVELEEHYWWHVAKRQLAVQCLQQHCPPPGMLLEGGVGSARNLIEFRELGYEVVGVDVMREAVEHAHQRGLTQVHLQDLAKRWPIDDGSLRAVVLLDVLEHVELPRAVLQEAYRSLEPGGCVVATVPAYPWLYSGWDRELGHYRRYRMRQFKGDARETGFHIVRATRWNSFSVPAAILMRGFDRLCQRPRSAEFPRVSKFVNSSLRWLASRERAWIRRSLPLPVGLSLVGVFRK